MSMQQSRPSTTLFRRVPLHLLVLLTLSSTSQAQSLVDMYEMAKGYDASYQSAKFQYEANVAKADQGKAALLPTVGLGAGVTRADRSMSPETSTSNYNYTTQTAGINATQPLYRPANLATYQQSQKAMDAAQATLLQAEQDLIVRTSQAYFDVLSSQDSLTFVKAQKAAVAEQLASAKRNFEVGTATITDTREAQARFDLVTAQEIAADNDLRVKTVALELLVGKTGIKPTVLNAAATLPSAPGTGAQEWITQSEQLHPGIRQARVNLEIAKLETEKAEAGHKPTVDFTLGYNVQKNINGTSVSVLPVNNQITIASVGITANMPLFAGFATQNRIRETLALEDKARNDLEGAQRQVAQATRTAYLGLQSGLGQVKALEAAEASSQAALDANKLGYQVGVRINIDVLNSQSQLFQTKRDLAKARYDVLVGQLKLRQASGTLKAEDLQSINALLQK
ncbi:channel protein TolC [Limnohabitans planktonicus II-D5]|jgi:outer membrane protein|uniref:Channel protein TolC n=2 Tax=Limnohabitans planktonicus TaxID=540060 RepID=A0A2T7UFL0_9BURK|nr:channel protein TolC [Limnohabitans planktonicus II-D5]|eukprot:gene22194-28304_t